MAKKLEYKDMPDDQLLGLWAHHNEQEDIALWNLYQGAKADKHRRAAETIFGILAVRQMGDVTGPGSIDPAHGAPPDWDYTMPRYTYNPSPNHPDFI